MRPRHRNDTRDHFQYRLELGGNAHFERGAVPLQARAWRRQPMTTGNTCGQRRCAHRTPQKYPRRPSSAGLLSSKDRQLCMLADHTCWPHRLRAQLNSVTARPPPFKPNLGSGWYHSDTEARLRATFCKRLPAFSSMSSVTSASVQAYAAIKFRFGANCAVRSSSKPRDRASPTARKKSSSTAVTILLLVTSNTAAVAPTRSAISNFTPNSCDSRSSGSKPPCEDRPRDCARNM